MSFPTLKKLLAGFILALIAILAIYVLGAGTPLHIALQPFTITRSQTPPSFSPAERVFIERAEQHLREHATEYRIHSDLSDLQPENVGLFADNGTVRFRQLYQSIPIENSGGLLVTIFGDSSQPIHVVSSYDHQVVLQRETSPHPKSNAGFLATKISRAEAVRNAWIASGGKGRLNELTTADLVVYRVDQPGQKSFYTLAWSVTLVLDAPSDAWAVVIDAETGKTLYKYRTVLLSCETPPCEPR